MVDICKVLEYLIKEFEKINGKNFKIYYVKVALPAETSETDREKIWYELWGDDENQRYSEYTQYDLFEREEDTEPSHIVYGALVGTNVTEGWLAIDDTIKKTVKQLLLRRYEPVSMPDSDTFLDNFSKFADTKVPIQQQWGGVYFWYEFLLRLSREQGTFINGGLCLSDLCMSELPCETKIQGLQTDVLTASKLALQYMLDKAEQRSRQKEFTGADRNDLSQEKPAGTGQTQQAQTPSEIDLIEQLAGQLQNLAFIENCPKSAETFNRWKIKLGDIINVDSFWKLADWLRYSDPPLDDGTVWKEAEQLWFRANNITTEQADNYKLLGCVDDLRGFVSDLAGLLLRRAEIAEQRLKPEKPAETGQKSELSYMSIPELAQHFGIDDPKKIDSLRKQVERARDNHTFGDDFFIEASSRRVNQPKYRYRVKDVAAIVEKRREKCPANVHQKKNKKKLSHFFY